MPVPTQAGGTPGEAPNQRRTPLVSALRAYTRHQPAVFHIPGHKQGRGASPILTRLLGAETLAIDLTEAPGLDDLHAPEGVIAEAQALAAQAFGADRSFFLVGGTTAGIEALILSACHPGDAILVPRHAHRSILGGLVLAGARPVYLRPAYLQDLDIPLMTPPATFQAALAANPDVRAAVVVHPTYHGLVGPTQELIQAAHAAGVAVLADEAHGSHFRFHPDLPPSALALGADGVAQSLHKTGGSMTQSSLLHLGHGSRLAPARVAEMLRLVQSTSPSYVLMASLDAARSQLALRGRHLWERAMGLAARARRRLAALPRIRVLGAEDCAPAMLDITRLVIDVRGRGITGFAAADWMWRKARVAVELAGQGYLLALIGPGDTAATVERLVAAVAGLPGGDSRTHKAPPRPLGEPPWPEVVITPREAYLGPKQAVALDQARGRVAAELVAPYPPGIPVVAPGERITPEVIAFLRRCTATGQHLQGPADPSLTTLQVVRE